MLRIDTTWKNVISSMYREEHHEKMLPIAHDLITLIEGRQI